METHRWNTRTSCQPPCRESHFGEIRLRTFLGDWSNFPRKAALNRVRLPKPLA